MSRSSSRRAAGAFIRALGLLSLASSLLVNPWSARVLFGTRAIDYADVTLGYFLWSVGLGALVVVAGRVVASGKARSLDGPLLMLLLVASLVLLDRLVLVAMGRPLWAYDQELGYRNRPGKVSSLRWYGRPDDLTRINRYGHHDTEFPVEKPAGEFRVLVLGDSVAMGDGVPYAETFSAQLEELLAKEDTSYSSFQVINSGVHGYSTFQELRTLEESLRFAPDVVVLGFCMNDVTEPFISNRDLGGVGLDYHGVQQTPNPLVGFLLNETGIGRLLTRVRLRSASREAAKRVELYGVRDLSLEGRSNPRFDEAWKIVLRDMARIRDVAEANRLPFVLLVFPFTFQLADRDARDPQRILREFAASGDTPLIDFTDLFEQRVFADDELRRTMLARGYSAEDVSKFFEWKTREYFRDDDHLTAAGHEVVARALLDELKRAKLLGPGAGARIGQR